MCARPVRSQWIMLGLWLLISARCVDSRFSTPWEIRWNSHLIRTQQLWLSQEQRALTLLLYVNTYFFILFYCVFSVDVNAGALLPIPLSHQNSHLILIHRNKCNWLKTWTQYTALDITGIIDQAHEKLFQLVLTNPNHVSSSLLPDKTDQHY